MAEYDNPRPSSQPIGSTDQAVAKDNLITLDRFVNNNASETEINRVGNEIKNINGLVIDANTRVINAIRSSGGVPLGDGNYSSGDKTYTAYNQYLVDNGVPYKPLSVPYTTDIGTYPNASDDDNLQPFETMTILKSVAIANNAPVSSVGFLSVNSDLVNIQYLYDSSSEKTYFSSEPLSGNLSVIGSESNGVVQITVGSVIKYVRDISTKYNTIADVKTSSVGYADGDAIMIRRYSTGFDEILQLHRDSSYDDPLLAGTDWNDNGSISDQLICFGPNGEAWLHKGKNVITTQLGISDEVGLTAAIEYVAAQKTTLTAFNDYLLAANGRIDLGGYLHTLTAPAVIPDTANGIIIENGMIETPIGFTGAYALDGTGADEWITNIIIQNVIFHLNHVAGGINMQRAHNWKTMKCKFFGFLSDAIRNQPPGTSNSITDCEFYEWHFGEPGFDNPANHTGTAIRNLTSDLIVKGGFIGYGKNGIYTEGTNTQVSHLHEYGLTGLGLEDNSAFNTYEDIIFDEPCRVKFGGATPGYGTTMTDCKFTWQSPKAGRMIEFIPNGPVELSGFTWSGGRFNATPYDGYSTISLTMTQFIFGESDITSSVAYFEPEMVGGTILGNAGGCARIIGYTSPTEVHVYNVEAFPANAIGAGGWKHYVTPFFANPTLFGTDPEQINISSDFFNDQAVIPITSSPVKYQMINNQENFEIEFGRWLILPKIYYVIPNQVEGTTTLNQALKTLYVMDAKCGLDFDTPFTGNVVVEAHMNPGLQ